MCDRRWRQGGHALYCIIVLTLTPMSPVHLILCDDSTICKEGTHLQSGSLIPLPTPNHPQTSSTNAAHQLTPSQLYHFHGKRRNFIIYSPLIIYNPLTIYLLSCCPTGHDLIRCVRRTQSAMYLQCVLQCTGYIR